MERYLLAILVSFVVLVSSAHAEDTQAAPKLLNQEASPPTGSVEKAAPRKVVVGSEVTKLESLGERSARTGLIVLGVLLIGLSAAKRFPKKNGASTESIQIITRKPVAPGSSLLVVQVEGRKLLLGQTSEALSLLTDLTPSAQEKTFAQILSEVHEDELTGDAQVGNA